MGVKVYPNNPKNFGKTSSTPRRPFEKERLDSELKLLGEYGLKNKRELWRVQLTVTKIRAAARKLLTLPEDDIRRKFEGDALIRRLRRLGIIAQEVNELERILEVKVENFLKRRLQHVVKEGSGVSAKSVHAARVLIYQRHLSIKKQTVTSPSFMVRVKSQSFLNFRAGSSLGGSRPGKVKRRNMKKKKAAAAGGGEEAAAAPEAAAAQ